MPHYKDTANNNQLYWLDDDKDKGYIPSTCVMITEEETDIIRAEQLSTTLVKFKVSPKQIRQALTYFSLRTDFEALISNSHQDIKDWWEFSLVLSTEDRELSEVTTSLNISNEKIREIFEYASTL